jgi:heme/copper-type cytochrome/quinol oxidase subunit 4
MAQCNCQKENSLLKNEDYKKYVIGLLLAIIIGLIMVYKNCGN